MPSVPQYVDGRGLENDIIQNSKTTRWRWMQRTDDPFPPGILIGGKRYWKVSDVLAWIARQKGGEAAGPQAGVGVTIPTIETLALSPSRCKSRRPR